MKGETNDLFFIVLEVFDVQKLNAIFHCNAFEQFVFVDGLVRQIASWIV